MSGRNRFLWDPGAQPERTYQAWSRTSLSMAVCGLLLARLTSTRGPVALVLAGCLGAAAVAVAAQQRRRLRSGRIGAAPYAVASLTAVVVGVAGAALALLVLRPGG